MRFPDAELWATDYLRRRLDADGHSDVFVGIRVPPTREPRMVVVRRVGGVALDRFRDRPRLQVRVFETTEEGATALAGDVRDYFLTSPGDGPVRAVRESGGLSSADDVQPARLFTFDLTTRGTA